MSDEEFGFSDEEVASREPDEFANMSEEEFNLLLEVTNRLMSERGMQDRQAAVDMARHTLDLHNQVMNGSGRIGFRKYVPDEFRRLVLDALIKGDLPCTHGHISPITDCGTCEAQKRANKYVMNPTKPSLCDHTRLDYSVPCPVCVAEEEDALEQKLAERARFRAQATKPISSAFRPSYNVKSPKTPFERLIQAAASGAPIPKFLGNEAELNAIIGVLLDKLGGEVHLSPEDLEQISQITQSGVATYAVTPNASTFGLSLERVGPTGKARFNVGGFISPPKKAASNPSASTGDPAWLPGAWAEDDDDLPF